MKRAKFIALGVVGLFALSGCSQVSTNSDETALHYKGGSFTSTSFANCVSPGNRNFDGPGDKHYTYPSGQRTYAFTGNKGDDAVPITVATKDNVELTVKGVITFSLNTDCNTLRKFHEQIGLKYKVSDDNAHFDEAGWNRMLATYLGQQLQRAMNEETQTKTWVDLYNNDQTRAAWESAVADKLPEYVKNSMGGDYFTSFKVTIQKPELPKDLQIALQDAQTAVQQNAAQQQRNIQVQSELESIKALVAVLGPDGYNTYQAIKQGKIQVMAIPQGSNIVLAPQK